MKFQNFLTLSSFAAIGLLAGCGDTGSESTDQGSDDAPAVDFVAEVKPILESECVRCHHDGALMGGLNLMNHQAAMKGSNKGPVIIPGDPEKSPLYRVTQLPEDQDHAMPATGAKLSDEQEQVLYRWIEEGAIWPEGDAGIIRPIQADDGKQA